MSSYIINYTETEDKAMQYVSASVDDWIQNAAHERARLAIDEIVQITVRNCLDNNIQIPQTKEAMVDLAFEEGWIETAEQRNNSLTTL